MLTYRVIESREEENDPALVLLHGMGSDEKDLLPIGERFARHRNVFSLRAPIALESGFAWYRFSDKFQPDTESLQASDRALTEWVEQMVPQGPFVMGGFSQGALMAGRWSWLHRDANCQGTIIMSGYLPETLATHPLPDTPFFWGHGTMDAVLPLGLAEKGVAMLKGAQARLDFKQYAMGHTVVLEELQDIEQWLAQHHI